MKSKKILDRIIYKTTNLINGKIYVGQDSFNNVEYFGSGKIIKQAIEKYGKENFKKEILEKCSSREELDERETFWIQELKSHDREIGYNISKRWFGGDVYTNNPNLDIIRKKLKASSREYWDSVPQERKSELSVIYSNSRKESWKSATEEEKQYAIDKQQEGQIKWRLTHKDEISDNMRKINKNRIFINNTFKEKHIEAKYISKYYEQGWQLGRMPFTAEHRKNTSKSAKNEPKIICVYYNRYFRKSNYSKDHGEKCKFKTITI